MKKQRKPKAPRPPQLPEESRAAEAATVAWMLSAMLALACQLCWVAASWWHRVHPEIERVGVLADLLFFSALVVGTVDLILIPVVLRSRRLLPPRGVTFFALVVGTTPWLIVLARITAG